MQIVSNGDNLHEMSNPVFWEKNTKNINLLSAEFAQRGVKVNQAIFQFEEIQNSGTTDSPATYNSNNQVM